ncbi:hypothetical protein M2336_002773 [Sphingobium sp. B1D7B]|nr:hypothetical protein [Sphingobium sp. B11D3A]MCW2406144.1 hypothetical protein [Sphingobium sp. B1D7B]
MIGDRAAATATAAVAARLLLLPLMRCCSTI